MIHPSRHSPGQCEQTGLEETEELAVEDAGLVAVNSALLVEHRLPPVVKLNLLTLAF